MKPKKIDRSTKKWREIYRTTLLSFLMLDGIIEQGSSWYTKKLAFDRASARRIKEAEEYADKLYSAMR